MGRLYALIREGEHQQQDFKFRVDDAKKIARTIAAFANTDGGRLLIGVKDNGKIVGIHPEEEFHIIQGAASIYCKPEVIIESNVLNDKHKLVLEVVIPKSEHQLIQAKDEEDRWKVYVRRDDHTLLASKIFIGVWKKRNQPRGELHVFNEDEKLLLDTIQEFGAATLSKLYKKTKLNKSLVDNLLITFVSWNIIEMQMTKNGTFFSIHDEKNN